MKIRTDFVTNSSSSSFVAINFSKRTILEKYLKKIERDEYDLYFFVLAKHQEKWKNANSETGESYATDLCTYLENYLESDGQFSVRLNEETVKELVAFIQENKDAIDFEMKQRMENADKDTLLNSYLKEHGISDIFSRIEYVYSDWYWLEVELQKSFSLSLCAMLKHYLNDDQYYDEFDDKLEEEIEHLIQFLRKNKKMIDYEIEGNIELRASNGEDGFAYVQRLNYEDHHGTLTKWPCVNGWNMEDGGGYDKIQEFSGRMFDGEIEELSELSCDAIWDIVWQDDDLEIAIEKTGKIKKFDIPWPISEKENE